MGGPRPPARGARWRGGASRLEQKFFSARKRGCLRNLASPARGETNFAMRLSLCQEKEGAIIETTLIGKNGVNTQTRRVGCGTAT